MEVKTNKEYTTMQHEIATAEEGVRIFEDQILTLMMEADELAASLKAADAAVAAEERKATAVRSDVEAERGRLEAELAGLTTTRTAIEQQMSPEYVRLFNDGVATPPRHRGQRDPRWSLPGLPGHRPAPADHAGSAAATTSCCANRASASSTCRRRRRPRLRPRRQRRGPAKAAGRDRLPERRGRPLT